MTKIPKPKRFKLNKTIGDLEYDLNQIWMCPPQSDINLQGLFDIHEVLTTIKHFEEKESRRNKRRNAIYKL